MADLSEVGSVLVEIIAGIVYPNGAAQPSIINTPVRIGQGWPSPSNLEKDLANKIITVSIFPNVDSHVDTFNSSWAVLSKAVVTLTADVSNNSVQFGGYASTPQVVALIVDGVSHVYELTATDTLESIAASVALLSGGVASGSTVSFNAATSLIVRIGGKGVLYRETRRNIQRFQITIWASCFDDRDPIAGKIDAALSAISNIDLPDGTSGMLRYVQSHQDDLHQAKGLYRRDIMYSVEYPTIETQGAWSVLIPEYSGVADQHQVITPLPILKGY